MKKTKKKKIVAKKKPVSKKKPISKKKPAFKKRKKVSRKPRSIIEMSREKFDYFMAKIAAI